MFPRCQLQFSCGVAHEGFVEALRALDKIKAKATLGAQEIAVDAALVAIIGANDFSAVIGLTDAESDFAAVGAMRAHCRNVVHLPGASFVAVATAGQCADGTYVNTHAALLAVELIAAVGGDYRTDAAVLNAQRPHIHTFAAHTRAAITKNAARPVIKDCG